MNAPALATFPRGLALTEELKECDIVRPVGWSFASWERLTLLELMKRIGIHEVFHVGGVLGRNGPPPDDRPYDKPVNWDSPVHPVTRIENIDRTLQICERAGLSSACDHLIRMRGRIERGSLPTERQFTQFFEEVRYRIFDQLSHQIFMCIPEDRAKLFDDESAFGKDVAEAFPHLAPEIEAAAQCLALGLGTECVFHLMRVVEGGLHILAKKMRAKVRADRPTWNDYIQAVEGRLAKLRKQKRINRKDEQFYAALATQIRHISKAWRNVLVHEIDTKYEEPEAEFIFGHIKALMDEIARRQRMGRP